MSASFKPHPAILVVDDEPDALIILRRLMRDLTSGYDILTASDGAEALAKIGDRPIPLVITDYTMPGMNGLQLLTEIKSRSPVSTGSAGPTRSPLGDRSTMRSATS